jgi:hypothetical protein
MRPRLFDIFVETLDNLPVEGIRRVAALEQRMLESDLSEKRINEGPEVKSIIAFCQFLNNGQTGSQAKPLKLPLLHVAYYRATLARLVKAGELAADMMNKFDAAVAPEFGSVNYN